MGFPTSAESVSFSIDLFGPERNRPSSLSPPPPLEPLGSLSPSRLSCPRQDSPFGLSGCKKTFFPAITCQGGILLFTEEGKIYSLVVNETQLDQPRSYTVQLALRKVSKCLPHISVRHMRSNQSSAVYLTGEAKGAAASLALLKKIFIFK